MRAAICEGLDAFGIRLDPGQMQVSATEARISAPGGPVAVYVIPANEEWIVARAAAEVVNQAAVQAAL